jgi:hypothetical protein
MAKIRPLVLDTVKELPKLIYTSEAFKKLLLFKNTTHAQTREFMFLGMVTKTGNEYLVYDFKLIPQHKCSGTYCESDDDRYPQWMNENIPIAERKHVRLHGHHHVNMSTSPSGTDNQQIEDLCKNVSDYYIQLIMNNNLENTVNIWDKTQGLIYEGVDQFIVCGKHLIRYTSISKFSIHYLNLDETPKITEESTLQIDENAILIPDLNKIIVSDDYLSLEFFLNGNTNKMVYLTTDKEKKDVEKDMKTLVKSPTTLNNYYAKPIDHKADATHYDRDFYENYYGMYGSYYSNPYLYDEYDDVEYDDEEKPKTKSKGVKKHGSK